MSKQTMSNSPFNFFDKIKHELGRVNNNEFKDELLIFMFVMNIMLVLIIFNFYIQEF